MTLAHHTRRAADQRFHTGIDLSETVRAGVQLQDTANTVTAVEFLAASDVHPDVIRRVLNGLDRRQGDIPALQR